MLATAEDEMMWYTVIQLILQVTFPWLLAPQIAGIVFFFLSYPVVDALGKMIEWAITNSCYGDDTYKQFQVLDGGLIDYFWTDYIGGLAFTIFSPVFFAMYMVFGTPGLVLLGLGGAVAGGTMGFYIFLFEFVSNYTSTTSVSAQ